MMGSPIVKSVFQPKHLAAPRLHIGSKEKSSEWSTVSQETTAEASSGTDYSEYDEEIIDDKTRAEPERLREAAYHRPDDAYTIPSGQDKRLVSDTRSPAVASLGQLLGARTGRFKLLTPDSDSSSSPDYDTTLQSKGSSVLTSTMMVGDTKESRPVLGIKDISVIKTRPSLDPRMSVEPRVGGAGSGGAGQKQLLSSTPARMMTGLVEESLGVSSIHSSDAGGSMLVPRVEREILTVERVEETDESEGEDLQQFSSPCPSPSTILSHAAVPVASVTLSSPQTLSRLIRSELASLSPPSSRDNTSTRESPSLATKGSTILPAKDSLHTIQSGSFLAKPNGSPKLPKRSTSSVSSTDTSGEIFSAVVHSKMVTRMVPYVRTPAKGTMGIKRKRFVLASRLKVASPPLSHFSQKEYYKGDRASERLFDQITEEELDAGTSHHDHGGVFSQE